VRTLQIRFWTLALVTSLIVSCSGDRNRPARADCISRAQVRGDSFGRVSNDALLELMPIAAQQGIPLAGYEIHGKSLYLQYSDQCASRLGFTRQILSMAGLGLSAPLSDQVVAPGVDTIDLSGPAWRD